MKKLWTWKAEHMNAVVIRYDGEEELSVYNPNSPDVTKGQKAIARLIVKTLNAHGLRP